MHHVIRRGPLVAAVLSCLIVPCAHAASVSQTGADGANPADPGQDVTLSLTNTGDASNSITVVGGNGAGFGNPAVQPNGGRGGNATATDTENFVGASTLSDQLSATGGNGGEGEDGNAGAGGTASVSAT